MQPVPDLILAEHEGRVTHALITVPDFIPPEHDGLVAHAQMHKKIEKNAHVREPNLRPTAIPQT